MRTCKFLCLSLISLQSIKSITPLKAGQPQHNQIILPQSDEFASRQVNINFYATIYPQNNGNWKDLFYFSDDSVKTSATNSNWT